MKKKILIIAQFPPPYHGASIMNDNIKKSDLINEKFDCTYLNITTSYKIEDIGKSSVLKYFKSIYIYFKIIYLLLFKNFDLCYLTLAPVGVAFYKDSLILLILKLFRKKIVIHLHGKGIDNFISKRFLIRLYYKFLMKNIYVIHLSESLYNDIKSIKKKKEVFFVNNGIEKYNINIKEQKDFYILFFSNIMITKGPFILLDAIKLLKSKNITIKVKFVGNWENDEVKKNFFNYLKENNLEEYVEYLGPKYNAEKYEIINNSSIFVLPTFYSNECFPLSILEAMQFEIPIISTFEGAIPDIIDDGINGFLVTQKDSKSLAEKIEILINNPELRKKMGENARLKFLNKYILEIFEKNLIKVFNKLLSE